MLVVIFLDIHRVEIWEQEKLLNGMYERREERRGRERREREWRCLSFGCGRCGENEIFFSPFIDTKMHVNTERMGKIYYKYLFLVRL